MSDYNSGKEGIFNEASLKMRRVDENWQIVSSLRTNMLQFNYYYLKYNFEILLSALFSNCNEVVDLMSDDELKQFREYREKITNILEESPVFTKRNCLTFSGNGIKTFINNSNWKEIRKMIFTFEDFTRLQLGVHGISNPTKSDPRRAIVQS